jgi:hypothetical protein
MARVISRDDVPWALEFEEAGCAFRSHVERVERAERRFLLDAGAPIPAVALLPDLVVESYEVETTYFASPAHGVLRLRRYRATGGMWLEQKYREDEALVKTRMEVIRFSEPPSVRVVAAVSYERTAYEDGATRITVDRDIRSSGRAFPSCVLEVKGRGVPELEAALPPQAVGFSKYRWARSIHRAPA